MLIPPTSFDYDECRNILHRALIDSLEAAGDRIRALVAAERFPWKWKDACAIDGVSYDLLPWHHVIALSFRVYSDQRDEAPYRYSPADWKHYDFMGDEITFDSAREYTHRVHSAAGDAHAQHEVMHLIFLAAADAFLDETVGQRLRAFGMAAPSFVDGLPTGGFVYLVLDEDKVFKANYCEIVIANRIARRLIGRVG